MWNLETPEGRLAALETLGPQAYAYALQKHQDEQIVATHRGKNIRRVESRFGTLYKADGIATAYLVLEGAKQEIDRSIAEAERRAADKKLIDDATEDAINALAKSIQDAIGQTDGGVAGVFFSGGEHRDTIRHIAKEYLACERLYEED